MLVCIVGRLVLMSCSVMVSGFVLMFVAELKTSGMTKNVFRQVN